MKKKEKKIDILTDNKAFMELCIIVYERNCICAKRTSIRNKLNRLIVIEKDISYNNRLALLINPYERTKIRKVPKKYSKMPNAELKLKIAYLSKDMAQVTVDQYEFTDRTRKALAKLKKVYNIIVKRNRFYNRFDGVIINTKYVKAFKLEQRAIDEIFEREVLRNV